MSGDPGRPRERCECGFAWKTQRWDEVTFWLNFNKKIIPEGRAESLRDRTALESDLSPSRAASPHHSQE